MHERGSVVGPPSLAVECAFKPGRPSIPAALVRNDVAAVTITLPNGTTKQLPVKDHAFVYAGAIASIRALDRSGNTIGTVNPTIGS